MAEAGIEPVMSTDEAAEYFDRTPQWIYWGLAGKIFVWPDGSPIVPERSTGTPGRRRFTPTVLRAMLSSSYRRGNFDEAELRDIIRRIRYTELGVEWRERENWHRIKFGPDRYRWVKPSEARYDHDAQTWVVKPTKRRRKSAPRKKRKKRST